MIWVSGGASVIMNNHYRGCTDRYRGHQLRCVGDAKKHQPKTNYEWKTMLMMMMTMMMQVL